MRRLFRTVTDTGWLYRQRGKIAGLLAGTLGLWIVTLFLVVAITGEAYGGDPRPVPQVYFFD